MSAPNHHAMPSKRTGLMISASGAIPASRGRRAVSSLFRAIPIFVSSVSAVVAQQVPSQIQLAPLDINAAPPDHGYASEPSYTPAKADLGPLGSQSILTTPASVNVVPEDLIVDQQAQTVNDVLRYLPSVEVRDQQGFEVSRPQSRGFMGSIVQNTRLDGLNTIGTTAIPAENLSGIQVLNGLGGALFGPETPAGVFDYILKRPTNTPLWRYIESYNSDGIFTEQADIGGRVGPDDRIGYRIDVVHGNGEDYVSGSHVDRTLASADLDFHLDDQTVIETDYSHYSTNSTGLPGSIVYFSGKSTILPPAPDPTQRGIGQPGAGADLITDTGLVKIKHEFNDKWNVELGGLYQNAVRNLFGITNTFTDNVGDFTVTKNFTAVPHFEIGSNMAYLNGAFDVFGMANNVSFGTNGFINGQYSYKDSIATVMGKSSLANPLILPSKPVPANGGQYESGQLFEQSLIISDTLHFTPQLAARGVLNTSWLTSESHSAAGLVTSNSSVNAVLSPTVSLIYTPTPKFTTYFNFTDSVEQGDQAPAGTKNANAFLSAYQDHQYEVGAKYAVSDKLLVTLDGFRMTRPLGGTSAVTDVFSVVGLQRNWGSELFVQGEVTPGLSVFGGVTYIDAILLNTGIAATDDERVVGVPKFKGDLEADYHPAFAYGIALTGAVHFESNRAANNTNRSFAPAYSTFDVGARYAMNIVTHHAIARFQVINVGDKHYYSSVADGNIVGSAGANTAYLGDPRTFLVSLEFDY